MPAIELTTQERSAQRAAAHPLHPVVIIGARGLTPAVLKEINVHLDAHQLIKIKVAGHERDDRQAMLVTICDQLSCAPIHHLGKTLIVYRPKAEAAPAAETTRAVRAPNAPHIPKKQAATGATAPAKRPRRPAEGPATARPTRKPAAAGAGHRVPRKAGSALSLRARNRARQK
ncbi:YhbY family RNA-binding protein [Pusillimonas sp. CC-YST705]|uniref:YhbY family RNA-binding protein n=1 Tax=Mesopusillimonas faecipullorum TaxID=2755040 RepID=A0ABS8CEL7_9BURK|nr:YhbY family RNA-binding protein [Mesopusillimonas faecipullorum]MCB5364486.1 YhbY family RNA-binding protein [Mesopusillimonas faecipullorum]